MGHLQSGIGARARYGAVARGPSIPGNGKVAK